MCKTHGPCGGAFNGLKLAPSKFFVPLFSYIVSTEGILVSARTIKRSDLDSPSTNHETVVAHSKTKAPICKRNKKTDLS